jgi:hypothetical protein
LPHPIAHFTKYVIKSLFHTFSEFPIFPASEFPSFPASEFPSFPASESPSFAVCEFPSLGPNSVQPAAFSPHSSKGNETTSISSAATGALIGGLIGAHILKKWMLKLIISIYHYSFQKTNNLCDTLMQAESLEQCSLRESSFWQFSY